MVTDLGNENSYRSINELLQWLPSEIINRTASIPTPHEDYGMDMCV